GGSTVQKNRPSLDHLFQHFPHFGRLPLNEALGSFYVAGVAILHQFADDKRPEQLQGHRLGQTTLTKLELGTNNDNGTARIIHTLTQQVTAEAPFLTFEHIGQRLQLATTTATERLTALAVVNQAIHRFLQHALFVADNYIRRTQLEQSLEPVI